MKALIMKPLAGGIFCREFKERGQKIVSINQLRKIRDATILKLLLGVICTFQLEQSSSLWINTRFSYCFVVRALTKRTRTPSLLLRGSCPARIRRDWRLALK